MVLSQPQSADLRALAEAVLFDPDFASAAGSMVCPPVGWTAGVIRSLGVPLEDSRFESNSGHHVYGPQRASGRISQR